VPNLAFGRAWLVGLALFVGLVAGSEYLARWMGQVPDVGDHPTYWSLWRARLEDDRSAETITILGASRAHLGLDPNGFAAVFPDKRVVELSTWGMPPLPSLYDLAENSEYDGIVVISMHGAWLLQDPHVANQMRWVKFYHRMYSDWGWVNKEINGWIQAWIESKLVVSRLEWNLFLTGELVDYPDYQVCRFDRHRPADFYTRGRAWLDEDLARRVEHARGFDPSPTTGAQRTEAAERIAGWVEKIESRGGRVYFVRMPTGQGVYEVDEQLWPRRDYWDTLARQGLRTIYWSDFPQLAGFATPEGSHLNYDDAYKFTVRLAEIISEMPEDPHPPGADADQ
jgi:hypothetical protein